MNTILRRLSAFLAASLLAATAGAHHSAVQFDFGKSIKYTGVVRSFTAINPHMKMTIELPNADGKGTHEVRFEGHSLNNMYRDGYRKGMVNIGDTITVNCAPFKSGEEGGYVVSVEKPNGDFMFGMRSRGAGDTQRIGEQVRKDAEGK
ncbi:MAG TPA: DUF6152 family protein [Steroidobacteraceae bacterium]|nr:DUF6152 family protein [Steroidobacteraceae bacterium]